MNTTPQMYTKVSFAKLSKYLAHTASAEEVNYIEVTDIEAEALSGNTITSQVRSAHDCKQAVNTLH